MRNQMQSIKTWYLFTVHIINQSGLGPHLKSKRFERLMLDSIIKVSLCDYKGSIVKKVRCIVSVLFNMREWPQMHTSAFKPTQNTSASSILRVCIHSDGSESLSLIVHNHTATHSNGSLIQTSNRVQCQFLSCALISFSEKGREGSPPRFL